MSTLTAKITFITCLTASLVLAGCGSSKPTGYADKGSAQRPPQIKTAAKETDPVVLAHLNARQQVDPTDIYGPHRYTTTPTAEDIDKDTNIRVVRLENQVADLRSDFKKLIPNISEESAETIGSAETNLNAPEIIEAQQQAAMTAPVTIAPQDQISSSVQVASQSPTQAAPETIAPAAGNATSDVTGVRVGEHPDKTRIVLDATGPAKFSYDIDNIQNILVIQLPQSSWSGAVQESLANNPLVSGYSAQAAPNGGTIVAVNLKQPARLIMGSLLEPNETYGYRIVFDVAPL